VAAATAADTATPVASFFKLWVTFMAATFRRRRSRN
jgi:hypothetical protein